MIAPESHGLSRRTFFRTAGLAGIAGTWLGLRPGTASAAEPTAFSNGTAFRFKIGEIEAFSISDGFGAAPDPLKMMSPDSAHDAMRDALTREFESPDTFPFYFNVLVLKIGEKVILFDGGNSPGYMPTAGHFAANLARAGITPEQVNTVLISHAHPDHVGGLAGTDGRPTFPKADHFILGAEADFWLGKNPDLSRSKIPADMQKGMIETARTKLEALGGKLARIKQGPSAVEGVEVIAAPGHTPGHAVFRIRSGDEQLFHIVDLAHNNVLMFADPSWSIMFDADQALAVETRKRTFFGLAADRTRVFGYHMPFPGVGHIGSAGTGYAWKPERWWWQA